MRTIVLLCLITLSATAADWPQWRGPKRDGVSPEKGLLRKWPKDGPKLLWKTDKAGNGLSSAAVAGGTVYTMGTRGDDEFALAFDGKGGLLWEAKIGPVHDWKANQWSRGPHATPCAKRSAGMTTRLRLHAFSSSTARPARITPAPARCRRPSVSRALRRTRSGSSTISRPTFSTSRASSLSTGA